MDKEIIICQDCTNKLTNTIDICPNCNSNKKFISLELNEIQLEIFDTISGKKENPNLNSKNRMLEKFYDGYDQSSNGDLAYKKQIISREKDYYFEEVKNNQGKIIRQCEEPLTNHTNRGSAKFKNNKTNNFKKKNGTN
jgi:hypothetical protein